MVRQRISTTFGILSLAALLAGCRPVSIEGAPTQAESCSPIANVQVPYGNSRLEGGTYRVSACDDNIAQVTAPDGRSAIGALDEFRGIDRRIGADGFPERRIDFVDEAFTGGGGGPER